MRESTKTLKNEMKKDIWMIAGLNNSKFNKRTPEQMNNPEMIKLNSIEKSGNINWDIVKLKHKKNTV